MEYKRFRIPNRDVKLTESEAAITRTRAFQRLFYLKQLGLVYFVYPCATHTRAGHSIECLDEAENILESIEVDKDDPNWEIVRMAALLHDMGHIPFSHTLEDENIVLPKHDGAKRVEYVLNKLKNEVDKEARSLVEKAAPILMAIPAEDENQQDWRSDLVGNTVCADLLAYIKTDAAWTGIEKRPGYYRIYDYFKVADKILDNNTSQKRLCIRLTKGGLRTDIVSSILDLLDMRYALTERVIFHHAKAIASAMLARTARLAKLEDKPELLDMGDEVFFTYLDRLITDLQDKKSQDGARMLLEHLRTRRLYKRIFKVERQAMEAWNRKNSKTDSETFSALWRNPLRIEQLLTKIEERLGLPMGALVLWCPEAESGMKLVKANVVWEQSGGWHSPVQLRSKQLEQQFPGVHNRVEIIENQYLDLWTLWIALCPEYLSKAPAIIDALSNEMRIECDSVFIETYAKMRLPGFANAENIYKKVDDKWRIEFIPVVTERIMKSAARSGTTSVDPAVIDDTIYSVSKDKQDRAIKKLSKERSTQTELFKPTKSKDTLEGQSK